MENLTKEQITVRVTDKNRKHITKTLKMFGQKAFSETTLSTYSCPWIAFSNSSGVSKNTWLNNWGNSWRVNGTHQIKTEVDHKQLRTILAREYLKEGDYVLCANNDVCNVFRISTKTDLICYTRRFSSKDGLIEIQGGWVYSAFKRYTTKKEIELLEGKLEKKELAVGKWYKWVGDDGSVFIFNHQENSKSYGWFRGDWSITSWYTDTFISKKDLVEATLQEVESALIEEAKRRGYKTDGGYIYHKGVLSSIIYNSGSPGSYEVEVFKDGEWAEIIEVDEFAELRRAFANGRLIEMKDILGYWRVVSEDCLWLGDKEYRIQPRVGDLVKAWNSPEGYIIGVVKAIEKQNGYQYGITLRGSITELYMNFEVLTSEEAQKLFLK